MLRTFHPIGQGAFYTEFFNNFTLVYDCGSGSNKLLIEKEIRATFKQGENIDAVFISHLHDDHVNGLEFLLDRCNVRRLFLPLLTDDEKLQLFIHNTINFHANRFAEDLIFIPAEVLSNRDTQLFFIPAVESEGKEDIGELDSIDFDELSRHTQQNNVLNRDIKLTTIKVKNWVFIPFNFQKSKRSQLLRKELISKNLVINNKVDFEKYWSILKYRKLIIEAYRNVPGNFNTNSLTLYSGLEYDQNCIQYSVLNRYCMIRSTISNHCICSQDPGCLYFGDYDSKGANKWRDFYNKYQQYWSKVGVVQIPHHGSRHNYNRNVNKLKPMISIISAGYSNKYRHPHSSTVRNIIADNGWPLIVNENIGSRVQFQIYGI